MVVSWDGTISSKEFYVAACTFSEQWSKFNSYFPRWSWIAAAKQPWKDTRHNHEEGFLSMERVMIPSLSEGDHRLVSESDTEECNNSDKVELADTDTATATPVRDNGREEHLYDFHVVYSTSYMVPMLYFRAYCSDGQPLQLDDIEKEIPISSAQLLARSKWTFITQEEHPHLNRPWYTLHPCGTSEWMRLLLINEADDMRMPIDKYLISWFSVVGQVFGFKMPFEMLNTDSS